MVKINITIIGRNLATEVAFKFFAPFMKCITKVDGTTIHNAEDLNLLMSIYKLLEYRFLRVILIQNVFLRFYSKDEAADFNANINNNNNLKSFKQKAILIGYS